MLRQLVSFGAVGLVATLTHVAVAWVASSAAGMHYLLANLLGAIAAFSMSFLGNARLTFRTRQPIIHSGPRYLVITFVSYVLASATMAFVEAHDLPGYLYAAFVLCVVPPTTFMLARLWVFAPGNP